MSNQLELVMILLRGIRSDEESYQQLRTLLEQQRICMIRRDSEALELVNGSINLCYQQLSYSTRLRRETLIALGVTPDRKGINQVFNWLPALQKEVASELWKTLERLAESCKNYNEKNGDLLTRQHEFAQVFLGTEPDFIYRW